MSSIFGVISVETPKYEAVKALAGAAGAEIRKYPSQVRAEVPYECPLSHGIMEGLNTPFRALAGYIFGGNTSRTHGSSEKVAMTAPVVMQTGPTEKIAMTAPVVLQTGTEAPAQEATGAAENATSDSNSNMRVMSFIMPSKYKSVADLPVPKNPRVRLFEVPERTFAAIRFRGSMTAAVQEAKEQELRAAAAKEGVKLSHDPRAVQYCGYNPPWCLPWLATNDILIPLAE